MRQNYHHRSGNLTALLKRCPARSDEWNRAIKLGIHNDDDDDDDEDEEDVDGDDGGKHGASPNSHKHFFPYMGFCVSIWDNVRHHCHRHHHHHHIQKSKSINTEAYLID